ncbi:helix-turn-helix domain-containing protein [Winogradskyella sp.]
MLDLYDVGPVLGFFFGLFAIIVVVLKQQQPTYRKVLLLLFLISLTWYCVTIYVVNSEKILSSPHLFRTGSPFFYLLSVSLFLLGRAYLNDIKSMGKLDYLLLLIPVLHIIELIPFYSNSEQEKLILIQQFVNNKDNLFSVDTSVIPTFWHYTLQGLLGILSSAFVLFNCVKRILSNHENIFKSQFNWLCFIALAIFLYFSIATTAFLVFKPERTFFQFFSTISFAIILIIIVLLLFLSPHLLYNVELGSDKNKKPKNQNPKSNLDDHLRMDIKKNIEHYFKNQTDFLKPEFRLQNLASHLNVNKNILSQTINSVYSKNFNQLLNAYRISYALEKINDKSWQNLSIEGMAENVGFKSRTTFNKAFKENTGCTPSEYISKGL